MRKANRRPYDETPPDQKPVRGDDSYNSNENYQVEQTRPYRATARHRANKTIIFRDGDQHNLITVD